MKKITRALRIDEEVWADFEGIAESQHMDPNQFAVVLVKTFSELKQGYALRALSSIPMDLFRARPGRKIRDLNPVPANPRAFDGAAQDGGTADRQPA